MKSEFYLLDKELKKKKREKQNFRYPGNAMTKMT